MTENLQIYEEGRSVPDSAKKQIAGGRLKGMTDINPMWRIKKLTEIFGPCGIGWKTEIVRCWLEQGSGEEVGAFMEILLYVKYKGEWSAGIPGTGGSMFVSKEKSGMYTDDECYKKAYTDALSVACKALGLGADVYWEKDSTKYSSRAEQEQIGSRYQCHVCGKAISEKLYTQSSNKYEVGLCSAECKDKYMSAQMEQERKIQIK